MVMKTILGLIFLRSSKPSAPGQGSGAHGLDHGVGVADEVAEGLDAFVGAEIEHDPLLSPIGVEEEQRRALDDGPGHLTAVVALGRFDLDDVGPEVDEVLGDGGRSEHRCLDDADALEGGDGGHGHQSSTKPTARARPSRSGCRRPTQREA
jgi:hypothetical protein